MKEFIDKLISRLEEISVSRDGDGVINGCNMGICEDDDCLKCLKKKVVSIVNELAEEYKVSEMPTGWIPCSERLPEEPFGCLVTIMDCNPMTQTDFENILPYHVGYDGETWNNLDGNAIPFEVIAWMPLPAPYTEGE